MDGGLSVEVLGLAAGEVTTPVVTRLEGVGGLTGGGKEGGGSEEATEEGGEGLHFWQSCCGLGREGSVGRGTI